MMKPQKPRAGLFGGLRNAFSQQGLAQTNGAGVSRGEQLGAMLMSLAGPQQAMMAQQNLMGIRQDHRDMMREQQERQGLQNTAQKQAMQERERLYAQADALGVNRGEFAMMPEETRNELFSRRYTPDQPDLPSSVREYEYARNQGFGGTFQNWQAQNPRGNSVTVNTGNQPDMRPQIGTIPQGFQARFDQQTGSYQMEPIPGSDPAMEREQSVEQQQRRGEQRAQTGGVVIDEVDRALSLLENPRVGGRMGAAMQLMPGTQSDALEGLYTTIGANVSFDRLQQMRENSPTGGALGNVSDSEGRRLAAVLGELRVGLNPEEQRYNLARLRNLLMDTIHGTPEQLAQAFQAGRIDQPTYEQLSARYDPAQMRSGLPDSGGLTPEEQRELEELERRFGGR